MFKRKGQIFCCSILFVVLCLASQTVAFKCITCDGANCIKDFSKDPVDCVDKSEESKTAACFTKHVSGKISRGCLPPDEIDACEKDTDNCKVCKNDKCNDQTICKGCLSSANPECAQAAIGDESFNKICSSADTKCVMLVNGDHHVERRCATADDKDENLKKLCTGANCNNIVYPEDRRKCFQCSGETCANVATTKADDKPVSKPCLLYEKEDVCYTVGTSEKDMTRGCVSDKGTATAPNPCDGKPIKCGFCDSDDCNKQNYKHPQTLKCQKCNSKDKPECVFSLTDDQAQACDKEILYNQKEACYTQTDKDNVVHRGCNYDREEALGVCSTENNCKTCYTAACNKDGQEFTCIRCNSAVKKECRNEADKMTGEKCRNDATSNQKCFTGEWNGVLIRGCLVDGDGNLQNTCLDVNNKQCEVCATKDCNNKNSGAATIAITTGLLATALLMVFRF